ncbi:LOW QUALITY PROTEIN: hypothetical protein TorRG33x02_279520 [Trema orientale]|uniref:Uncharacterized protein n=1 Tax=Trema orientale TaxID=63057 RepID=A0A2P5CML8_TREOI|nr:LOW QUALITY PROTEIN: hypothetical protein TorRG33x02_279520 [Trema orientale]
MSIVMMSLKEGITGLGSEIGSRWLLVAKGDASKLKEFMAETSPRLSLRWAVALK